MIWILLSNFCLGGCIGMIYTFAVYQIIERRYKRKYDERFEYYIIYLRSRDDEEQILDDYGDDGWEVFEMMPDGSAIKVYLKRKKQ